LLIALATRHAHSLGARRFDRETCGDAWPNRAGAAHAAFLSRDKVKARTYYAQLVVVAKRADPDVAPITEAKAFLGAN
jgi:hypothetical protein